MRNKVVLLSLLIMVMALLLAEDTARAQQSAKDDSQLAVYVIGQVVRPQGIPFKQPITVTQAIAMAGGVLPDSGRDRVRIYRNKTEDKTRMVILVDLKAITKRRAEDVFLQPYDIVEVLSKEASKRRKKECPHPPCVKVESIVPPKYLPVYGIL